MRTGVKSRSEVAKSIDVLAFAYSGGTTLDLWWGDQRIRDETPSCPAPRHPHAPRTLPTVNGCFCHN
jgi:hypothetical protein